VVAASVDRLIGDVYEAALLPSRWPSILAELRDLSAGAFASLVIIVNNNIQFVGTPEAEQLIADYVALGKPGFNPRIAGRIAIREQGYFADHDMFSQAQIDTDPFYREFLRPRGYGWVAADCVRPPTGEIASVSIERHHKRGPFEAETLALLNRLAPHFSRATLLSMRLGLSRAEVATKLLEQLGLPGAVMRVGGRVLAANAAFTRLIPAIVQDRRDRLTLTDRGADALLVGALDMFAAGGSQMGEAAVGSIPIAAREHHLPMILHLLPVQGAGHDIFSQAECIAVVTPVDRAAVPSADLLQGLFDLTPAEARVARHVGEGGTIDELAAELGRSRNTVRQQLRGVFAKAGVTRQAELAALLGGLALPLG
jgi:DNA-binding CsgD family transcriptional regulator